ncbi:hypothetical protein [Halomicrobium urmianum]|uniref:hypothetical protein n=1 Tax=Halomicrobium urmianum TaxID=1586233 RepID=UPI001CDA4CAF|nr:hypothetical protein [Halomicrobium urmianum]
MSTTNTEPLTDARPTDADERQSTTSDRQSTADGRQTAAHAPAADEASALARGAGAPLTFSPESAAQMGQFDTTADEPTRPGRD